MTRGAREFVTPLTFQALSGRAVRTDLWDPAAEAAMGHIELARWADLVLVAPASADFIARLAGGRADDLLATTCLATTAPVALAPAMNHQMWLNAATQANVEALKARGVRMLGPGAGDQACGETGPGRMLEPLQLTDLADAAFRPAGVLRGRRLLITAGPTREPIDPVRFISNRSSGKMGFAVAQAAREAGAEVLLVAGPVSLPTPPGVQRVDVESAQEMLDAVLSRLTGTDIFISTAAVADYRPDRPADRKIKKTDQQDAGLTLTMVRTTDIIATVSGSADRPAFVAGFAAETNDVERHALSKLERKQLDLIAANEVGHHKVFDCSDNELLVLWPGGGRQLLPQAQKTQLARDLIDLIATRFAASRKA